MTQVLGWIARVVLTLLAMALLLLGLLAVAGWPMARRRAASASHH